ncbi:hypothetical protein Tco_1269748 [Tanacetum coccineum]
MFHRSRQLQGESKCKKAFDMVVVEVNFCLNDFWAWSPVPSVLASPKYLHTLASPQSRRDALVNVSGGVSGLGFWNEDNTCWAESLLVSPSGYVWHEALCRLLGCTWALTATGSWALVGYITDTCTVQSRWTAGMMPLNRWVVSYSRDEERRIYLSPYLLSEHTHSMSGSEPGEMAPESSQAVVFPKFDMHIYTSILTDGELKDAVFEYYIPVDLHPRLPPPGLTMNKLPSRYIDIYLEQLEQRGLRDPFSTFFLAGHWFLFKNKTGGRAKKCFKEVNSSLKGWKKKFFLIDRRAMPDAMPWRHTDTDLHDDFPTHYNENNAACLAKFIVPFRPPPRHLLYMYGLTTTCRHLDRAYNIKDQDGNASRLDRNNREAIPEKSAFQKNLEKPNSKIAAAREKKDQQNLAKAQAKRAGEGGSDAP